MDERKPTPEEQLLKLIENPDAAAPKTGTVEIEKKPTKHFFPFKGFAFFKAKATKSGSPSSSGRIAEHRGSSIKGLNWILIAAVIAAGIYLALDLTVFRKDTGELLSAVSIADAVYPVSSKEQSAGSQRDISYYQKLMDRRNPFVTGVSKEEDAGEKPEQAPVPAPHSEKMAKVMESIKLVGISWTGDTGVAMIEEVTTGKTLFLRAGQEINDLKVQRIEKEKVTVTYEGEEAELF